MIRFRSSLLFVLFVLLLIVDSAQAQSLISSKETSADGDRPKSTQIGFFELMESAGDAFLDKCHSSSDEPTVSSPRWNSQASPRDTVMTFVEAMNHVAEGRRKALPRAKATLAKVASSIDAVDPEATATDLLHVFDRLPEISPGTIPGPQTVQEKSIRRYELFPRGIENQWAYKALGGAPKGSITLVLQDGQWVFDESTVKNANKLAESMQAIPPRSRAQRKGQLFLNVIEPTFRRTSIADWFFFVVWSVGGVLAAWGIYRFARHLIRSRSERGDDLITPMLTSVLIPTVILCVTLATAIGSARIQMHPALSSFRWNIIEAAVILAGVYLVVSLIELACLGIRRTFFGTEDPYAKMMSLVVRRGFRVLATVILLLFVFQNVFKWNVTALIGGVGILALALSLAAQDAVKNLFGAMTIFANRPFINGDWIRFNKEIGTVEDVSLQVTRVRLLSGEVLSIPNMKFIDSSVENLSMRRYLRRVMDVAITYDTPPEKVAEAREILLDILQSDQVVGDGKGDLEKHPPQVWFDQFGSHYLNLRADYWYMMDADGNRQQRDTERGWFSYLDHATVVNQSVLQRFNDAGIDFAFPTQTVYLTDDPDRGLAVNANHHEKAMS